MAVRLTEALNLDAAGVIAIVGGGGKTIIMYRLARETAEDGGRAIATGTTLFTPPPVHPGLPLFIAGSASELEKMIEASSERGSLVVAAGHGNKGRLLPMTVEVPALLAEIADVTRVIVEADGSRGRPFKAPAEHEPVIPGGAALVIAVAGMPAVGAPLDEEHVHRPEQVAAITGGAIGAPVTVEMIAAVLADERGGRKHVPLNGRFAVVLNQVEAGRLGDARAAARLLLDRGVELVVLARAAEPTPVVEILR